MRLAIVATPADPHALDGDAFRARVIHPDVGFEVCNLDPAVDLAEQLDELFDRKRPDAHDLVLFYASCRAVVSSRGEFFICLDEEHPETGDGLSDLTSLFADRISGPVLFMLECRHAIDPEDPFASANLVGAAKAAVKPQESGIALLIAARPETSGVEEKVSPFTQAFLTALDEATQAEGLSAEALYDLIQEGETLLGVVPGFAHAKGRTDFELFRGRTIYPPSLDAKTAGIPVVSAPETKRESKPVHADDAPMSQRKSILPVVLPDSRSFQTPVATLPRVMISEPPARASAPPNVSATPVPPVVSAAPVSTPSPAPVSSPPSTPAPKSSPPTSRTPAQHVIIADSLALAQDHEGALNELKKALVLMGSTATKERAEILVRIGEVKRAQGKTREAIASFEKALQTIPAHVGAQAALLDLSVAEKDWRAVQVAEERMLASISEPALRFEQLVAFGARWAEVAKDVGKARAMLEKAREIKPADLVLLAKLRVVYEASGSEQEVLALRREMARLTDDPRGRAKQYFELAQHYRVDKTRDDTALELLDLALDSDPSMLEPLEIVATLLAERQEWSELEKAYRRMLDRAPRITKNSVRTEVTWELCRRLGLLFRDHLEDPRLALDAFEDSLEEKPRDLGGHLVAAELAKSIGENEKAIAHLMMAARLDSARAETFHGLFELFQRGKQPDLAFCAASVTVQSNTAESRERFIFEEHRAEGVPKFQRELRPEAWELLRPQDGDQSVEAILTAIAPAAIAARIAQLGTDGRLPVLDPELRQDPEKSTVSITRSFVWASHFLSIPSPAIYVREDTSVGVAAVLAEEPTVIAGSGVLRGRTLPELAFLVGRHLGYYAGAHRLLLYYPSIEELSACFIAGVKIALPDVPIPSSVRDGAAALKPSIEMRLSESAREALVAAVAAFDQGGGRADIGGWVSNVERCATRAGALLCGDLGVALAILRSEPRTFLDPEQKIADLLGFWVSDEHHTLRQELGIAIEL